MRILSFRLPTQSLAPDQNQQYHAVLSADADLGDGVFRQVTADAMIAVQPTPAGSGTYAMEML